MDTVKIHEFASQLYHAHGDRAELEAAQRARKLEEKGNMKEAQEWKRVKRVISEMRGANYS